MLCFASVFNIIVFYCAFKEKIRALHSVGVALMFIGIVCIGIAAATADEDEEDLEDGEEEEDSGRSILANTILALGVGFGGPLIISTQAYTIRRFSEFYSGLDQAIDAAPI